ncbi:MAG TPA: type II CAAX endopeptidase family protein [Oligoflexus sp.]|uniref:CPBP family intramembrane glutamic endopeptidase n=1 Tax=Oligoflexus sp. TaxID=1971216 RepID=UPI002D561C8F|nr:type II CAAX endopeptidase family protein [Oligoflexus sp.]HYX35000.1 type II CAAX endopeptidase family protein [Oligoflexus sp.]
MKALREPLRISSILLRYKFLQTLARLNVKKNKKPSQKREAQPVKTRMGGLTLGLLYSFLAVTIGFGHFGTLREMTRALLDNPDATAWNASEIMAIPSPIWSSLPYVYWLGLCVMLLVFLIGSSMSPLTRVNHTTQDHDLEWISTFPVSLRSFLLGRIFQSSAMNPLNWIFLVPLLFLLVLMRGTHLVSSLAMAALVCSSFALISNSLGVLMDGLVQTRLSPTRQRDIRAIALLLMSGFFTLFYFAVQTQLEWYWRWVLNHWERLASHPLVHFMNEIFLVRSVQPYLLLVLATALTVFLSVALLSRLYRQGLASHSGYERSSLKRKKSLSHRSSILDFIPVMVRREWQLLARDRTHLIQSIAPPLIYLGIDMMSSSRDSEGMSVGFRLTLLLMMPFLMITTSATTLMHKEKSSLWQYAIAPRRLVDILADRQKFWLALAFGVGLVGCSFLLRREDFSDPVLYFRILVLPLALWMYEGIALSIVIFFHDPFNDDVGKRPSLRLTYLLMTIAGILLWAVVHGSPWNTLVVLTLFFGVKLAFRQNLNDYEPYVLDPSASPRTEATLGDGLIAALIYFILQAMITAAGLRLKLFTGEAALMWGAFLAAVLTFIVMQLYYRRNQALGVPEYSGPIRALDGLYALCALPLLLGIAELWIQYAPHWTFWKWLYKMTDAPQGGIFQPSLSFYIFAGLVAPFIEEFIFRGLIFGGMKRRFGLWPSLIVSSLIFALVHPPLGFVPVFLGGMVMAWLYHRTQVLLPSVLLHIGYNLFILSLAG